MRGCPQQGSPQGRGRPQPLSYSLFNLNRGLWGPRPAVGGLTPTMGTWLYPSPQVCPRHLRHETPLETQLGRGHPRHPTASCSPHHPAPATPARLWATDVRPDACTASGVPQPSGEGVSCSPSPQAAAAAAGREPAAYLT